MPFSYDTTTTWIVTHVVYSGYFVRTYTCSRTGVPRQYTGLYTPAIFYLPANLYIAITNVANAITIIPNVIVPVIVSLIICFI